MFLLTSFALIQETPASELATLLAEANLVTVSTLVKPDSVAERARLVPQRLSQAVALINSDGTMRSTKARETSLFNAYEKFVLAGKGVFTKPNNLGTSAFEFVAGEEGKQGKLILYADSSFKQPLFFLRWNGKRNSTEYLFRTVEKNVLRAETINLHRDGSGTYQLVIEKMLRRKLSWNGDGTPQLDESF